MAIEAKIALVGHTGFGFGGVVGATETAAASAEAAGYPASNLLLRQLGQVCRSPAGTLTGWVLTFGFGRTISVGGVVLVKTNLRPGIGTRRVELAMDSGFSTNYLDSGTAVALDASLGVLKAGERDFVPVQGWPVIWLPTTASNAAFCRVTLADSGNPDGHLQAGFPLISERYQPPKNFDQSWAKIPTARGSQGAEVLLRGHKLNFHLLNSAGESEILSLLWGLKHTGRVYVIPRATKPETWRLTAHLCEVEGDPESAAVDKAGKFYAVAATFREVDE